jgi:hypothetical protein
VRETSNRGDRRRRPLCWIAAAGLLSVLVSSSALASEVVPATDAAALRAYDNQSLRRVLIPYDTFPMRGPVELMLTWTVSDGGGAMMSAVHFANLMGDAVTVEILRHEWGAAWTVFGLMLVAGAAAVVSGVLVLVAPGRDEPLSFAQMRGGGALLGIGGGCLSLSWLAPFHVTMKQRKVSAYYSPEAADAMIEAYNDALRSELGIPADQALDIDLHGRRPSPRVDLFASLSGVRFELAF